METVLPVVCITLGVIVLTLLAALNLKFLIWLTNKVFGPGTVVPGILKCVGLLILVNMVLAAIYFATVGMIQKLRPASPNSWEEASGLGSLLYMPLCYLATSAILWKMVPTTFARSLLVAFIQGLFLSALAALLFFLVLFIAFAPWRHSR